MTTMRATATDWIRRSRRERAWIAAMSELAAKYRPTSTLRASTVSVKSPSETKSRPVQATEAAVTTAVVQEVERRRPAQEGTWRASAIASIPRAVGTRVEPRLMIAEETTATRTTRCPVTGAGSTALYAVPPTAKNPTSPSIVSAVTRCGAPAPVTSVSAKIASKPQ